VSRCQKNDLAFGATP